MNPNDLHRRIIEMERRQREAARRHGEMVRARREAIAFELGPDGVWRMRGAA